MCKPASGACGNVGFADADCSGMQWCSRNTCTPKVANGQPLPNVAPISGMCTMANGMRVCLRGVCDTDNNCGYANGGGACTGMKARTVCPPSVWAAGGADQGKSVGVHVGGGGPGSTAAVDGNRQ